MIVIGIDPGAGGGIAVLRTYTTKTWSVAPHKMPETESDTFRLIEESVTSALFYAFIEHVHAVGTKGPRCHACKQPQPIPGTQCRMCGQHRQMRQGIASTAKFMQGYGFLRGCLHGAQIPFEAVSPGVWQREFGLVFPKKLGLSPTEKKNRHKARAQELFPGVKVIHATADALLIATYGRRTLAARERTSAHEDKNEARRRTEGRLDPPRARGPFVHVP